MVDDTDNPCAQKWKGTTLRLMEEAGMIAATRHVNRDRGRGRGDNNGGGDSCNYSAAALVRFETMAFHKPIFVGEVASCTCEVIFTSRQSVLVEVMVYAEDLVRGETRVTNTGWLWYVPIAIPATGGAATAADGPKDWSVGQVTQMPVPSDEAALKKYEEGKAHYRKRKSMSQSSNHDGEDGVEGTNSGGGDEDEYGAFKEQYAPPPPESSRTPSESEQVLCQMVLPGDCGTEKIAHGGFVMKLMDNAAGCSAWRHCRSNVVTVAISDLDFLSWVRLGDLCTIRSRAVFASSKSLEIEVVASVASATVTSSGAEAGDDVTVARGLFTFVSLSEDGRVQSVPKLMLESEEDMRKAFLGQKRYEAAKRARSKR